MEKKTSVLIGLVLIVVFCVVGFFIYNNFYSQNAGSDNNSAQQNKSAAESKKEKNQKFPMDLADELMGKRKKLGHATYEFAISATDLNGKTVYNSGSKIIWDDYYNYGEQAPNGSFMGVNKGLLYLKNNGEVRFKGSLTEEKGGFLLSMVFENYVFDNLLWNVKKDPDNSKYLGEETIDGKKYHIFENKIFPPNISKETVTRKFWICADDGTVLKEEIEDKIDDYTYTDPDGKEVTDKGFTEYKKVEIKSSVFSKDKRFMSPVSLLQARFPDSDGDGLVNDVERKIFSTDPDNPDTDGDGYKDGAEVDAGYDPTVKSPQDNILQ